MGMGQYRDGEYGAEGDHIGAEVYA